MMLRVSAILAAFLFVTSAGVYAYSTFGGKWTSFPVVLYVNPANRDVSTSAAVSAIQTALTAWNTQSGSAFRYSYGGAVSDTATAHDYRNVVFFRDASNGGVIATTYSWWSSTRMLDSDVVFWDGGFKFYTGTSGCTTSVPSAYIEDVATHELGHALGLGHSSASDATMYSTYTMCTQTKRTLAADDIAGAKALYGLATGPVNTAPVVTITSPANGATFVQGTTISLAATATDTQDGNISSRIQWTDNGVPVGSGNLVSSLLSLVGIHTIVAKVTDNNGVQSSSQVAVTVTLLQQPAPAPTATVSAQTAVLSDGTQKVTLNWTGLPGTISDIYQNNTKITYTANDGSKSVYTPSKTAGTYYYFLCAAGTATCTNTVKVVF